MKSFRLQAQSACRLLPAWRTSSTHRRKMAYALALWQMSLAQYWKDLRRTPDLLHGNQCPFSFVPEFLDIIKSAVLSTSMPSVESAWMFGKKVGMKRCATDSHSTRPVLSSKLENESAIWAGGFTKRSNATAAGRSRMVIRSSSSALGRETKDLGSSSAIACCTRTATTFMSRSSI